MGQEPHYRADTFYQASLSKNDVRVAPVLQALRKCYNPGAILVNANRPISSLSILRMSNMRPGDYLQAHDMCHCDTYVIWRKRQIFHFWAGSARLVGWMHRPRGGE
jgi:hypothetical protein